MPPTTGRTHPVTWVDAFTDQRFGGNPCAVVFDADAVDVETRIAFTRETRLSECAFLQHSERADVGVRYYVASGEIPMAGHPTIATVVALVDAGEVALDDDGRAAFTLEVGAGVLPVEVVVDDGLVRVTMTQLRPTFGRRWEPDLVAPLVGLRPEDFRATPRTVSTGTAFLVTPLASHDALRRAALDVEALHAFHADHDTDFFEPFLTAMGGATPDGDVFSRLLLTPPEPPEDPFTGSATGCLGAWLWAEGELDDPSFVAEQGHDMGRPGRADVEVLGPPDAITGVRVGGTGVVVLRGDLDLSDPRRHLSPGVVIDPVRPPAAIEARRTGVAAFIGETEKNLGTATTTISSMAEYAHRFGDGPVAGEVPDAVRAFFDNGGQRAVVAPAEATPDGHAAARAAIAATGADLLVLPPPEVGGDVDPGLVEAAVTWAEDHGAMVLLDGRAETTSDLLHAPRPDSPAAVVAWPRVRIPDDDRPRGVAGALAGLYARTDLERGVWKAPAGVRGTLRGVTAPAVDLSDDDVEALNHAGIVPVRRLPARGVAAWGARTTSSDPEWRYVPVRRLATWIEGSVQDGLDWTVFEPNDEPLWETVTRLVEDFLLVVFRDGGLVGQAPRDAFYVRCGRSTMTQADLEDGSLRLEIGFAPLRPAEFVVLRLHRTVAPSPT